MVATDRIALRDALAACYWLRQAGAKIDASLSTGCREPWNHSCQLPKRNLDRLSRC